MEKLIAESGFFSAIVSDPQSLLVCFSECPSLVAGNSKDRKVKLSLLSLLRTLQENFRTCSEKGGNVNFSSGKHLSHLPFNYVPKELSAILWILLRRLKLSKEPRLKVFLVARLANNLMVLLKSESLQRVESFRVFLKELSETFLVSIPLFDWSLSCSTRSHMEE